MRKYFQIYTFFLLLIIFCTIAATQWLLSNKFTEKRIQQTLQEISTTLQQSLNEKISYAQTLGDGLINNPELSESIQFMKLTGDTSLCSKIVTSAVQGTAYDIAILDLDGKLLFSSNQYVSFVDTHSWNKIKQRLLVKKSLQMVT